MLALWIVPVFVEYSVECFRFIINGYFKIPTKIFEIGLKRLFPLALLCAIFFVPLSQKASQSVGGETAIFDRSFDLFWDGVSNIHVINQAKLTDFFSPFTMGLWVTKNYDLLYETIYIGLFTSIFAVLSLFGRTRYSWMFFVCAVLFFAMSLGPYIRLYPGADVFASRFFYTVARYIPFIEAMEVPWEYSFMGIFAWQFRLGMESNLQSKICQQRNGNQLLEGNSRRVSFWNSFGSLLLLHQSRVQRLLYPTFIPK